MKANPQTAPDRPSEAAETAIPEQWEAAQEASPCSPDGPADLFQDDPGEPSITDIIERIRAKSKPAEPSKKASLDFPSPAPAATHQGGGFDGYTITPARDVTTLTMPYIITRPYRATDKRLA